ncbi:hemagglutinin repeat-containing protein [Massilia niabensis]|uniref:Hemagglutinin repeat-containing protein n=1 Tax=Massilia niabensis TaxID=544910 RepID=A0ABW0L1H7_9BURK
MPISASGDVNIEGAQGSTCSTLRRTGNRAAPSGKSSSSASDYLASTTVVGSSVTGGSVAINAGNDVKINDSEVLTNKALTLAAGRDLLVGNAMQVEEERHSAQSKKSGFSFSPTAGIGHSQSRQ